MDPLTDPPHIGWYRRDGSRIEGSLSEVMGEWWRLHERPEYLWVAKTTIGEILISTVWLGMDHASFSGGPPMIFESMTFWHGGGVPPKLFTEHLEIQHRYPTEAAALAGHDQIVELVKDALAAYGQRSS